MSLSQAQLYCQTCQRWVLSQRPAPNHLIHAIVTLFTCFVWGIVWLFAALNTKPYRCPHCGGTALLPPSP
jgi:hypothetical protein